jgi:hypothetical protein
MDTESLEFSYDLLRTGTSVLFRVLEEEVLIAPADEAEFGLRVHLKFTGEAEEMEDEDDEAWKAKHTTEWGAFGFLFVLAVLSFSEAKPRGLSEAEYKEKDDLRLADFMRGLSFSGGALRYEADYIRGRRIKTRIAVRPDGTVTLETLGRGKAALRWLERLQGKELLQLVGG